MALPALSLILKGAARQGLSNINEANEFYGDLIKNAALNIGNAAQSATNNFPNDVDQGKEVYKRYLSLVESLGKDKADYIALQTDYLERDNWDALAHGIRFGNTGVDATGNPTFKYTGASEPIDTMNKRINKNISGVTDQLTNASSMKGMKKYTDFYLGQVPDQFALDPSRLPETTTSLEMTDAERAEAAKFVILPTEVGTLNAQVAMDVATINSVGGDTELAKSKFGLTEERILAAKLSQEKVGALEKVWMASPMYQQSIARLSHLTPGTGDYIALANQIDAQKTIFIEHLKSGMLGEKLDNTAQAKSVVGTLDKRNFSYEGKKYKWPKLVSFLKNYFKTEKNVDNATEVEIIKYLLDTNQFIILPE